MNQRIHQHLEDNLPRIRTIVRSLARDANIADDLTQECCVRIIEKEHLWDKGRDPSPWMAQIARRLTVGWLRSSKCEQSFLPDELEAPTESLDFDLDHISWVLGQFKLLSEMQKKVLQFRYFEGLSGVKIAQKLNITPQSVDVHHRRALKILRSRAKQQGLLASIFPFLDFKKNTQIAAGEIVKYKLVTVVVLACSAGLIINGYGDLDKAAKIEKTAGDQSISSSLEMETSSPDKSIVDSSLRGEVAGLSELKASLQKEIVELQRRETNINKRSVGEHVAASLKHAMSLSSEERRELLMYNYDDFFDKWNLNPSQKKICSEALWNQQMGLDNLFLDLLGGLDVKSGLEKTQQLYAETKQKLLTVISHDQLDEIISRDSGDDRDTMLIGIMLSETDLPVDQEDILVKDVLAETRDAAYCLGLPFFDAFEGFKEVDERYIRGVSKLATATTWQELLLDPWEDRFNAVNKLLSARFGKDQVKAFQSYRNRFEQSMGPLVKLLDSTGPEALMSMELK